MNFNAKINSYEAVCLIVTLLCSKLFVSYPIYLNGFSGFEIIFINLLSFLMLSVLAFISYKINFKIKKEVRNTFFILLVILSIVFVSVIFLKYIKSLKWSILSYSPIGFITFIMLLGIIFGVFSGIRGLSKMCSFFIPPILLLTAVFVLLASPSFDEGSMFPVFGNGTSPILKYAFFMLSSLWEFIFISFFPKLLKKEDSFLKVSFISLFISFLFYAFIGVSIVLSGVTFKSGYSEIFKIIRLISPLSIAERPDSVFFILYVLLILLYVSVMSFFIKEIYTSVFNIKHGKELVIPATLIISSLCFSSETGILSETMYRWLMSIMSFVLLLLPFILQKNKEGN